MDRKAQVFVVVLSSALSCVHTKLDRRGKTVAVRSSIPDGACTSLGEFSGEDTSKTGAINIIRNRAGSYNATDIVVSSKSNTEKGDYVTANAYRCDSETRGEMEAVEREKRRERWRNAADSFNREPERTRCTTRRGQTWDDSNSYVTECEKSH